MDQSAASSAKDSMDVDSPRNDDSQSISAAGSPQSKEAVSHPQPSNGGQTLRATSVDMLNGSASTPTNPSSSSTTPSTTQHTSTSPTSYTAGSPSASGSKENDAGDSEMADKPSLPTFDEQFMQIYEISLRELQEGRVGYVVARAWLSRPMSRTTDGLRDGSFDKEAREGEIGPIDNSDIALSGDFDELRDEKGEPFIPLRPECVMSQDYEVLPTEAWTKLVSWYGLKSGTPEIRRYVHDTTPEGSMQQNLQYELSPPILTIRKLRNDQSGLSTAALKDTEKNAPQLLASHDDNFQKFLAEAKKKAGIDLKTKVKVWRVIENIPVADDQNTRSGMLTPATSRDGSPAPPSASQSLTKLLIDVLSFTNLVEGTQREMVDVKDETGNDKYNGHLKLSTVGLGTNQVLILEEQIGGPAGGEFVSDNAKSTASKLGVPIGAKNGIGKGVGKGVNSSRGTSPAPSGPVTRGRTRRDGKTRGTVGLTNLGNTCYMNSALQCIRSIEELSLYFLQEEYKKEINADNPLGHNGVLAKTYASLLTGIYDDTNISTFTPRVFKATLGRLSSTFSGYQQQDSQEFLSFLVDGLHEDLNRIHKKPYVENPESNDETHQSPELITALGEKFRENHRARNDSVAMDLFNGFYKNTMVCPECDKVSITFDPYSLLTLQLPVEQTWQHIVTFVPLHGRPIQVDVDIDKNASIRGLKEFVAKRFPGVKAQRLMCAEIYSHKFYKVFEDRQTISENNIQPRDEIAFFELPSAPTNFPPPKKKTKTRSMLLYDMRSSEEDVPTHESPLADRMVVPVYSRTSAKSTYGSRQLALWPFFVVITREEAANADEIFKKVLAKVATMTTTDIFNVDDNFAGVGSNSSFDGVLTTEEDASSTDQHIQAKSVEGEGSIVDVTMTETPNDSTESLGDSADSKLPEPLRPGAFIQPELQRLFQLKYAKGNGKEMVQTGFSTLQAHEDYPAISTRIPIRSSRRSSIQSQASGGSSASSTTEDTQQEAPQFSNHNEDDSDASLPPVEHFNRRKGGKNGGKFNKKGGRRGNRKMKTYGKKGKQNRLREGSEPSEPPSDPESPPRLIRLGEALMIDWETETFDSLFGAKAGNTDDLRGSSTWEQRELFDDPDLVQKREQRSRRKKNGVSLDDCFNETAKSEILSEENAWYCNRCKELRRAEKTLAIWTAPDILVLHLKRFRSNRAFRDKVDVLVDFPIEGLDISSWVGLPEDKSMVYDLFAVDNHYGGLGGGHYTAFAQNFYDKQWYEYNDSSVSQRKPVSCVTSAAYLLFYRRRSYTPLGPQTLQNVVQAAWNPNQPDGPEQLDPESNSNANDTNTASGNGQRAHDLSRNGANGSSSALAGAGVGHGSAKATTNAAGAEADETENLNDDDPDNTLPSYFDEGYDDDNSQLQPLIGPIGYTQSNWSFERLSSDGQDNDSTRALSKSGGAGDLQSRLEEDFGDDPMNLLSSGPAGQVTPEMSGDEELKNFASNGPADDEDVVESMEFDDNHDLASRNIDGDDEVVDIRVGKGDVKID